MQNKQLLNTHQRAQIQKEIARQAAKIKQKTEKSIEKKVEKQTEKKLEKEVQKQVKLKLAKALKQKSISAINKTKTTASKFKKELKKHTSTAIAAAFAFLIALSWRQPIKDSVDNLIKSIGLASKAIYIEYLSAIIITIIAVLALMLIAKWTSEPQ